MCNSEKESLSSPANLTRQAYQAGQPSQPKSHSSRPSSASWPNSWPSLFGTLLVPAHAWASLARNRLATAAERRDLGVIAFLPIPPCPLFRSKKGKGEVGSCDWRGRDSPCPRYHLACQGIVLATQARFLDQSRALCPLHAPRNTAMGHARNHPLTPLYDARPAAARNWERHGTFMIVPRPKTPQQHPLIFSTRPHCRIHRSPARAELGYKSRASPLP
jgi:hypothetical protein